MFDVVMFYFQGQKRAQYEIRHCCMFFSSVRSTSTHRKVGALRKGDVVIGKLEHDSHADTIVLGQNAVILGYTGRECEVSPYTDTYESIKGVPIVKGATGYTSATTGERCILVFNEALGKTDKFPAAYKYCTINIVLRRRHVPCHVNTVSVSINMTHDMTRYTSHHYSFTTRHDVEHQHPV